MHYATNIIVIRCKFKYSTRTTLNVNSACAKLNKPDKTECSAKQYPNTEKRVENTPHGREFLTKFEVFGYARKHCELFDIHVHVHVSSRSKKKLSGKWRSKIVKVYAN